MALKGFLALVDDKLSEAFEYVAPDKTKGRKPFLSALDKAKAQFEEGKQPRGANAMWSANNKVVRFTPKIAGVPVSIDGKSVFHVPQERFVGALAELRKEVEAGDHDEALHDAGHKKGKSKRAPLDLTGAMGVERHMIDYSDKPQRAGWSPERRAKYEATQAAKKAEKAE